MKSREKKKKLEKVLWPIPPSTNLSDIQDFEYFNRLEMPNITKKWNSSNYQIYSDSKNS